VSINYLLSFVVDLGLRRTSYMKQRLARPRDSNKNASSSTHSTFLTYVKNPARSRNFQMFIKTPIPSYVLSARLERTYDQRINDEGRCNAMFPLF